MHNTYVALIKCVQLIIKMVAHSERNSLNNHSLMIIGNIFNYISNYLHGYSIRD